MNRSAHAKLARLTATRVLVIALCTSACALAGNKKHSSHMDHEVLRGRVIADIASLASGAGLGPKWTSFIFVNETSGGQGIPSKIAYAFYKHEQLPPDSFWDYSKLYELKVKREPECDTTVEAISYEKNRDEHGNNLPPTFILRFVKNAPSDSLKPETVLPCYVLWYGQYRQLDSGVAR